MPVVVRIVVAAWFVLAGAMPMNAQKNAQEPAPGPQAAPVVALAPEAVTQPPGLPAIGRWMIARDGTIAHWLGQVIDGRNLHEPINVILVDEGASSADDARQRLVAAAAKAGFPVRFGHSTGYHGLIGGVLYGQLPQGRDDAFSNRIFEESNNHGRVFGPHRFDGGYLFIAAFSRERVNLLHWPAHRYESFNAARDGFARGLDE